MKSILLSIRPEWVAKILNGEKTIEVRKQFPKDFIGWVYIYCTRNGINIEKDCGLGFPQRINGKVVARFWCDKVEEIEFNTLYDDEFEFDYHTKTLDFGHLVSSSKITYEQMNGYLGNKNGYAIHISKLEIFDKPRELSEFDRPCQHCDNEHQCYSKNLVCCAESCKFYKNTRLTKEPQNYCYIEGDKQ